MIFADLWIPLQISLSVACTATLLVTGIGTLCAWWLAGKRSLAATIADYLLSVHVLLPPTVLGYGLILFLGNSGSGGSVWSAITGTSFLFSRGAAVTAAALAGLPLYYRTAKSFFESIELHLFEAAAVDGAGRRTLLTAIILPISIPGLSAGFILAFLRAMGEFGIPDMIREVFQVKRRRSLWPFGMRLCPAAMGSNSAGTALGVDQPGAVEPVCTIHPPYQALAAACFDFLIALISKKLPRKPHKGPGQ
ncbi:MAG: ABC transporter permease subunit [Spirochaetia bacterium]|nr:ABC transporter permease subunit [Spirochaetia bacterium]